jgi:ligand-binding sensor domain-containing protein
MNYVKCFFILIAFFPKIIFSQNTILFDTKNTSIPADNLVSVAVDNNGVKWIGSSKNGLIKFDNNIWTLYNKDNSPIKGNYIHGIVVDKKNKIWFAFSNPQQGLACFDGKEFTVFTTKNSKLPTNDITSITLDKHNNKWIGTYRGMVKFDDINWTTFPKFNEKLNYPVIRAIDIDENEKAWVATNSGLASLYKDDLQIFTESNSELYSDVVMTVKIIDKNKVYAGYNGGIVGGGFSILEDNKWKNINQKNSALPNNTVRDIEYNSKNDLWFATNDGILEIKNNKQESYIFREGVHMNAIMDICIEKDSLVWIATPFGLLCRGNISENDFFQKTTGSSSEKSYKSVQQNTNSVSEIDTSQTYIAVSDPPHFAGGSKALSQFINKNLKYPQSFKGTKTVLVEFVIEKDGTVTSPHLLQLPTEFDNEIIRLIKSMPKWIAGKQSGITVRVQHILPIKLEQ